MFNLAGTGRRRELFAPRFVIPNAAFVIPSAVEESLTVSSALRFLELQQEIPRLRFADAKNSGLPRLAR